MTWSIFRFELSYTLRRPLFWVYAAFFFIVPAIAVAGRSGWFGDEPNPDILINSPWDLYESTTFYFQLFLLLLPALMGTPIFRDVKSGLDKLLFSYPIKPIHYWWAKWSIGLFLSLVLSACILLGLAFGTIFPSVDSTLIAGDGPDKYLRLYGCWLLPNVVIFGTLIFVVIAFSRNLYLGYAIVLGRYLWNGILAALLGQLDSQWILALVEPTGEQAIQWSVRYWSSAELFSRSLPVDGLLIWNRGIWLLASVGFLLFGAFRFRFVLGSKGRQGRKAKAASTPQRKGRPTLSTVQFDESVVGQLKSIFRLALVDLRYLLQSRLFHALLGAGILLVLFQQAEMRPAFGFKILPVTWKLLNVPTLVFSAVILMMTYLFAGLLIQRARLANMDQLVDASAVPTWVLIASKYLALVLMQVLLFSVILVSGVSVQLFSGFTDLRLGLYLFDLYGLKIWTFFIWGMASFLVQAIVRQAYLGFFLLFLGSMGIAGLTEFGIEHFVFRFSHGPRLTYSDLTHYGDTLEPFVLYKSYWLFFASLLALPIYLCWYRGFPDGVWHRIRLVYRRCSKSLFFAGILGLSTFVGWGTWIYTTDKKADGKLVDEADFDQLRADSEKNYKYLEGLPQPKIAAMDLQIDLWPAEQGFSIEGRYQLVNKTSLPVDTLLLNFSYDEQTTYTLGSTFSPIKLDSSIGLDILALESPMRPGDTVELAFTVQSIPQSLFVKNSGVYPNGTFLRNEMLPGIGYRDWEHRNPEKRKRFGLPARSAEAPDPLDRLSRLRSYQANDADLIDVRTILSAPIGQEAFGPGKRIRSWTKNGRVYREYQTETPIKKFFGFNFGTYALRQDSWETVSLEIYHHPDHVYNLDRMMKALKAALSYCTDQFSAYPHSQIRIVELPITAKFAATTFANTIPMSEALFLADIQEDDPKVIDLPFFVTAHEMAHQWWGNQLIPADASGAKLLTESLAEYTALSILEKEYGPEKVRQFLAYDLELYLSGRKKETRQEHPLATCQTHEKHIHYRKGAIVLYHLSRQVGEERFNALLADLLEQYSTGSAPFPTSYDLIDHLKKNLASEHHKLIQEGLESIVLYDNKIVEVKQSREGEKYQLRVDLSLEKYRLDPSRTPMEKEQLEINEVITLGIYRKGERIKTVERRSLDPQLSWVIELEEPADKVVLDPWFRQIDKNPRDNVRRVGLTH
ncbi:MAG: M1 family aminopeptidase [Bacteroidota bacterium]